MHVIGTVEVAKFGFSRLLVALQKMYKKNSGVREEINSSFRTSFHMKEISGMYLNIFDMSQGAKAQLLITTVTFPTPTTKHATIVSALLINILCTVCCGTSAG
jgi:hypothetical protein